MRLLCLACRAFNSRCLRFLPVLYDRGRFNARPLCSALNEDVHNQNQQLVDLHWVSTPLRYTTVITIQSNNQALKDVYNSHAT